MQVQPLQDRILVERAEQETKTASGLIIPDGQGEKPAQGKVVAVGPGRTLDSGTKIDMEVAEGDLVLFGKYAGTEVKVDGKDFLIMNESDVLGKFVQ